MHPYRLSARLGTAGWVLASLQGDAVHSRFLSPYIVAVSKRACPCRDTECTLLSVRNRLPRRANWPAVCAHVANAGKRRLLSFPLLPFLSLSQRGLRYYFRTILLHGLCCLLLIGYLHPRGADGLEDNLASRSRS